MGRTACTEPQCLYKGALYLYLTVELYLYSPYGPYGLYRASVPLQGCTLPLPYSRAIPLLSLWAVRPVQGLSACTRVHFTFIYIYIHIYIYIQIFIYIYISLIFSLKYCCWCSDVHVLDSLRSLYFSLCTVSPTINWILTCCRYQTRIKHFQLFGLWKFSAVKLDKKVLSTAWKLGGVEVLLHSFLAFWHRSFTFKF